MARKRGGLAGFWDRKKGIITPVATGLAGLFGGPLAGAALGAAMRGFDRPGQGGIGVDLGQAARGGLEGYGMGSLGAAVGAKTGIGAGSRQAVSDFFSRKAAGASTGMGGGTGGSMGGGMGGALPADLPMSGAPSIGMTPTSAGPMNVGTPRMAAQDIGSLLKPETGTKLPGRFSRATKFLEDRSKTIEGITKGIQMAMPSPGSEAAMMNAETQRQQLEMQRQQMQEEQRRRETIAALLMPMYQQMMQSRGVMPPNSITQRYG
jgi:hypothetical protein